MDINIEIIMYVQKKNFSFTDVNEASFYRHCMNCNITHQSFEYVLEDSFAPPLS